MEREDNFESIEDCKQKLAELQLKNATMEKEFGEGRAMLKQMYLQKEEELRKLNIELEEATSRVVIAECTAENRVEAEQRKCAEELATLQQLAREEAEASLAEVSSRYEEALRLSRRQAEALKR